jgi:hypothetical protein
MFEVTVFLVALIAGAVASVTGFGIGSLVTPVLMLRFPAPLAVAMMGLPHVIGTGIRWWRLRRHVDIAVLKGFGLASAAGGLTGAILHSRASAELITKIFAALLILSGLAGLTGIIRRLHFHGHTAWVGGLVSGLFGGLAGNQGGLRSAALLAFPLSPAAFVATATATALIVDAMRLPVYFITKGPDLVTNAPMVAFVALGVVVGTFAGERVLTKLPAETFRRVVATAVLLLGIGMLLGRMS